LLFHLLSQTTRYPYMFSDLALVLLDLLLERSIILAGAVHTRIHYSLYSVDSSISLSRSLRISVSWSFRGMVANLSSDEI
jgi:hypothetical protein